MALVVADRVKETTTTTGTGAISLGGAQANFATFSSALSDGDTTYYAIVDNDNVAYEVGLGTYTSSGNTLTRTTVLDSSNSGSAVSFGAGQKDVFVTYPADKSVYLDASGKIGSFTSTGIDDNATSTAITIDSDERVGINITPTNRTFEVKSIANAQIIASFETGSGITGRIGIMDANTTADSTVGIGCRGNNLEFYAGAAAKATLSATGNLSVIGGLTAAGLAYPTSDGTTDQFLKTNGSGTLAFADVPAGIESTFTVQTSSFTSVASVRYYISTAGGAVTMTLPASPTAGDQVAFVDYTGNFATTAAVLGRNGSNIMGSASDMNLDVDYFSGTVEYVDATQGWKLI